MKKAVYAAVGPVILFLVVGTLILSSCDDFYSSSWGSPREYKPSNIDLNVNNLDAWFETAIGNPELAMALLEKIKGDLPNLTGVDKAKYQEAGVKLAVEASGIGASLLSNAAGALDKLENADTDTVKDILTNIQNDFKNNNGDKIAQDIVKIMDVSPTSDIPKIGGDYASLVTPADAGQAVLVLALAVIGDINGIEDLKVNGLGIGLTLDDKGSIKVDGDPTDEARALAAYLNLIADAPANGKFDSNPMTKAIKDAFGLIRNV